MAFESLPAMFTLSATGAIVTWAVHMLYAIQMITSLNNRMDKDTAPCPPMEIRRAHAITFYVAFSFTVLFYSLRYLRSNNYI